MPNNGIIKNDTCYTYNDKLLTNLVIDYNSIVGYQYNRIVPDYFRYVPPDCTVGYTKAVIDGSCTSSACLREQLLYGPIILYSLEELFIRLVPSITDSPEVVSFKDNIRNEFIAFCLNIEKSYLFFNKGKKTCNNNFVPWDAIFFININSDQIPLPPADQVVSFLYAKNVPLTQYDQYVIYNLSVNYFFNYFQGSKNRPFNYYNILRLALGLPIVGSLTTVNFYDMVYISFIMMSSLFKISQTLLLGKDPGLPKQFVELYFPLERQKYYYNYYLSWIQSRDTYLGFGSRINVSNGSGTYIPIPGLFQ